jgi:hypothetical protein
LLLTAIGINIEIHDFRNQDYNVYNALEPVMHSTTPFELCSVTSQKISKLLNLDRISVFLINKRLNVMFTSPNDLSSLENGKNDKSSNISLNCTDLSASPSLK